MVSCLNNKLISFGFSVFFIKNTEKIERNNFFVRKPLVGVIVLTLYIYLQVIFIMRVYKKGKLLLIDVASSLLF